MLNAIGLAFCSICVGHDLATGEYGWAAAMGVLLFLNLLMLKAQLDG